MIERTRAGGMVVGVDGDPPLQMQLVSNLADVVAGDVVVASGADGVYPKGFAIGKVEKSERGTGLYRQHHRCVRPWTSRARGSADRPGARTRRRSRPEPAAPAEREK